MLSLPAGRQGTTSLDHFGKHACVALSRVVIMRSFTPSATLRTQDDKTLHYESQIQNIQPSFPLPVQHF